MGVKTLTSKDLVPRVQADIKELLKLLEGQKPQLAVVLVGDSGASLSYVKKKKQFCESLGMDFTLHHLPASSTFAQISELIFALNEDSEVDGILLQLPLPNKSHLEQTQLLNIIYKKKDVDALTDFHQGALFCGRSGLWPCTPYGVVYLMDQYKIPVRGKHVVIIGKSSVVGAPLFQILSRQGATLTLCHSETSNVSAHTRASDVVISATGVPNLLKAQNLSEKAYVIDVGVHFKEGKMFTDVSRKDLKIQGITSRTGSVGPLTVAFMARNLVLCSLWRRKKIEIYRQDPFQKLF